MGLLSIFEPNTWLLFCVTFFVIGITWFVLGSCLPENHEHKSLSLCLLNGWSVFLGISANNRPRLTPLRIFFVMIALYGLNVTTIYTSKLITVFTSPFYQEQIDTIEEIIDSGLPFGLNINLSYEYWNLLGEYIFFMVCLQADEKTIAIGLRTTIESMRFYI